MVFYQADKKKKKSSLVSFVNKLHYHDTYSDDIIANVQDTDYLFFVWSCYSVSRKQHIINIICIHVRTSHLISHEICFYSIVNDFKEVSAIS